MSKHFLLPTLATVAISTLVLNLNASSQAQVAPVGPVSPSTTGQQTGQQPGGSTNNPTQTNNPAQTFNDMLKGKTSSLEDLEDPSVNYSSLDDPNQSPSYGSYDPESGYDNGGYDNGESSDSGDSGDGGDGGDGGE